jgi:hypothetical protein
MLLRALVQEIQDFGCLFARRLPGALRPSRKRLLRNPYRLGYFRSLLDDDVPIVSKCSELFFGRFHKLKIQKIATVGKTGFQREFIAIILPPGQLPDLAPEQHERTPNCVR